MDEAPDLMLGLHLVELAIGELRDVLNDIRTAQAAFFKETVSDLQAIRVGASGNGDAIEQIATDIPEMATSLEALKSRLTSSETDDLP
jgi:hypothetical protein